MPDALFDDPRFARLYDPLDPDRGDLDVYAAIVDEFKAQTVLDVGCGTGTFACLLARSGRNVVGVDPARASLDVARTKPGAESVRWIHGDATTLPPLTADLAFMTGNVAQVFLTDEEWMATLAGIHSALRPGGRLVFESRDPEKQAWREWTRERTYIDTQLKGVGRVRTWTDLAEVAPPFVTFESTLILPSGETLHSTSTLRFRSRDELERSLVEAGYTVDEVRDAPDRPGREFVFVARAVSS
ncbi:class I SAM-dependent methyltransferase [Humibacter sp.]|jgi:ubiquinone/menaquinone biosynthesis C-methylase UbiE|uniref:class I SAM-dependent methyltransferase n=1 Tax=Humibacter sp. TaxID=1940291 RepID=UPI002BE24139|nr:class I SAM-dependent methyltransferase [Humibacter sp.]HVX09276.1 class I SAM-dependent methyltransferase [Humibacter sp.]